MKQAELARIVHLIQGPLMTRVKNIEKENEGMTREFSRMIKTCRDIMKEVVQLKGAPLETSEKESVERKRKEVLPPVRIEAGSSFAVTDRSSLDLSLRTFQQSPTTVLKLPNKSLFFSGKTSPPDTEKSRNLT